MRVVIKQLTKFFIIGVSAVLVDAVVYYLLSDKMGVDTKIAKSLSFLTGTVYTYFLNKLWTWKYTEKSNKGMVMMFMAVYAISFIFNVVINEWLLHVLPDQIVELELNTLDAGLNKVQESSFKLISVKENKLLAFFVATVVSAVINFLGQKFLVFKQVKLDPKDETNIEVS